MSDVDKLQEAGVDAYRAGNYEAALEGFQAMLAAATEQNLPAKRAEALNNLGVIYRGLDEMDKALASLQEALDYYQDADDELGEAKTLGNFGMVEEAAGKYDDAVQSYIDAATIFEEHGEDDLAMYTWQALSRLKLRQKEWVGAIAAYEEGIAHLPDSSLKKKMLQRLLKVPGKFMG